MQALRDAVDAAAERTGFSGVVRVDRSGQTELCAPYGFADRAHRVPNTTENQFAVASGSKGLTALAVMSLVERGMLGLGTTVRTLLGADLPLIAGDVTVEHLLAHRSGIGDHLDEDAVGDTAFLRPDELPGRAARGHLGVTACGPTCSTCPCSGTATAAATRPRQT